METPFEKFCSTVADQNVKNIVPCNIDCQSFVSATDKTDTRTFCNICWNLQSFSRTKTSMEKISLNKPFSVNKIKYIIRECSTKEDALNRFHLSNKDPFFLQVMFVFRCGTSYYACYVYVNEAPSIQKEGEKIRKFFKEYCPDIKNQPLLPRHVRMNDNGEFCVDPEPFSYLYEPSSSTKRKNNEEAFVSLLVSYINENKSNIDIVGRFYNSEKTINELKAQALSGNVVRSCQDYFNLVPLK